MYKIRYDSKEGSKEKTPPKDPTEEEKKKKQDAEKALIEESERERIRLEKKKRSQEEMVADFVKLLESIIKPRQTVTSMLSAITGAAALATGGIFYLTLPLVAERARELALILIVYGIFQVALAASYLVTCVQTAMAVKNGVKGTRQIIAGALVLGVYALITSISFAIGLYGFYKLLCICGNVDHFEETHPFYCPKPEFALSSAIFVLHLINIVVKCCCCK